MQLIVVLLQQYSTGGIYASVSVYNEVPLQIWQLQHRWVTYQFVQLFKIMPLRFFPLLHMLGQHDMHQRRSNNRKIMYVLGIVIC